MAQPLPPHLQQNHHHALGQPAPVIANTNAFTDNNSTPTQDPSAQPDAQSSSSNKNRPPYGSGDSDDGYTLVFPNIVAFQAWRAQEEETQMVEFVKGDTHQSKAVPPRFKDHTKLVCARHSRSGRKKYVKKHPERIRKVPSRKLEGQGCPASISYKTYFDTDEVRVCYTSQHSHSIGISNLPYTRRGRRQAVADEKARRHTHVPGASGSADTSGIAAPANQSASPSQPQAQNFNAPPPVPHLTHPSHPYPGYGSSLPGHFSNITFPTIQGPNVQDAQWERMTTVFGSIRDHARTFDYPAASVAALEAILLRLYLESPMGPSTGPGIPLGALALNVHGPNPNSGAGQQNIVQLQGNGQQHQDAQQMQTQMPTNSGSGTEDMPGGDSDSEMESG